MTEQVQQNIKVADSDEIDLRELFSAIWAGKWIIIATTFLFSVAAVFYALSLPNIYKSEVTLAPAGESGGLNIPGQLGGLAALAGVNLGGKGGDKTALALEILKSREFLGRFIEENDLYVPIMAAKGWDRATDKLLIDPEIYNEETKQWVRIVEEPFKPKPSVFEAIDKFEENIKINENEQNGIVTINFHHFSPRISKTIVEKLVVSINENMRSRDLLEAERSILYLNKKINETHIAEVRGMLFSIIEEQTKTLMLTNVRGEYVFSIIDKAIIAEIPAKPHRTMILLAGILIGWLVGVVYVLATNRKK